MLIVTVGLFSLTGCQTAMGIDKFYYIIALGIDFSENHLLKVSIQTTDNGSGESNGSSGSGSSQSSNYKIYSVEAETIDSAITILNNYLSKKVNLSHCSALVFSEEVARSGISPYISALNNNTELRHSCEFLISSGSATDVLDMVSKSGESFTSRLFDYLTTSSDYTGYSIISTFGTFFSSLQNSYRQPCAVYTEVKDDIIQNSGIAVFRDDTMIGTLNVLDSISHLMVTNALNTCQISIDSPFKENEKADLQLRLYKNTDISFDMINHAPYITLDLYPEGTIISSGESFDYTDNNHIKKMEQATNDYIENIMKQYLYRITKEYQSDIAGFSGKYSSEFLTKDEFDNTHFQELFRESFFEVHVHTQINSSNLFNKQ